MIFIFLKEMRYYLFKIFIWRIYEPRDHNKTKALSRRNDLHLRNVCIIMPNEEKIDLRQFMILYLQPDT